MVLCFIVLSTFPKLGRLLPPLIGAVLIGAIVVGALGRMDQSSLGSFQIVKPVFHPPLWSLPAMVELVLPLAITVLVVQNGQGFAVLHAADYEPPINAVRLCVVSDRSSVPLLVRSALVSRDRPTH